MFEFLITRSFVGPVKHNFKLLFIIPNNYYTIYTVFV
jgi:hypothetical protein